MLLKYWIIIAIRSVTHLLMLPSGIFYSLYSLSSISYNETIHLISFSFFQMITPWSYDRLNLDITYVSFSKQINLIWLKYLCY
jgi:hypothetical protein